MGKSEKYRIFKLLQPETCKVVDAKQQMESMKVCD